MHKWSGLEAALSRWESEGGARSQRMPSGQTQQAALAQSMNTQLEHLGVRTIAMENLLITMLAQATEQHLELCREVAAFISARPGFAQHPGTIDAADQMVHLLRRAQRLRGWFEGDSLS